MRVGVYLVGTAPSLGGGFTFQDDIFESLLRLESKHSFVIFSDLDQKEVGEIGRRNFSFVSLKRGFLRRALDKMRQMTARGIRSIPIVKKEYRPSYVNWIAEIVRQCSVEVMWFVAPGYVEVDVPHIFTVLDLQHRVQPWFPEVSSGGEWRRREALFTEGIQRASVIIIGAEAGRNEIAQFYGVPRERIKLIPHPTPRFALMNPRADRGKVSSKYGLPKGYLFYPAQFWPHKNHLHLLLAMRLLREKEGLVLPLVLAGSDQGNLEHVRRISRELGLSQQVHFLGFVPQEDLVGLYLNAVALVYPTFFGPENLPPLEAFALGCPVIASNVAGAQEQMSDAALLVDPQNDEDIAAAIKRVVEDRALRETLVERGLKRARQWTGEDYVRSVLAIIDEFESVRRCWGQRYQS